MLALPVCEPNALFLFNPIGSKILENESEKQFPVLQAANHTEGLSVPRKVVENACFA